MKLSGGCIANTSLLTVTCARWKMSRCHYVAAEVELEAVSWKVEIRLALLGVVRRRFR